MSEREWCKSTPESCSVLIFGEVFPDRPPATASILFGQRAYEAYQIQAYLEGLLMIRHHATYVDWSPLFCSLYAGMIASGARRVLEIGPTLFATIDKLEKLQRLSLGPSVHDLEYVGVEPSTVFCQLAEALHPNARIVNVANLSEVQPGLSVNRCYQATSYAFDTTEELINCCSMSVLGVHGIWFSHDGTTKNVAVMGKKVTLFSLPEFVDGLKTRGYAIEFIQKSHSIYLQDFEYFETWLVYHKLSPEQELSFRHWLARLSQITGEEAHLFPSFELAPLRERTDLAYAGPVDPSRILDFTSPRALEKLAQWKSLVGS